MIVIIDVESQLLAIANIYVPPPFKSDVLYTVLERVATFGPLKLLVADDFNNILDYALDTSNPSRVQNLDLGHWVVIWRLWRTCGWW